MAGHEPRCSGTKTCSKCGEEKHVLEFRGDPKMRDGVSSWCRSCHAISVAKTPSRKERRRKERLASHERVLKGRFKVVE